MLAWWRTGLASLAVALAVGRLLPELSSSNVTWPYVLLGLGFGIYGTGLFLYGTIHNHRPGRPPGSLWLAAGFGTMLAIGTMIVIVIQ